MTRSTLAFAIVYLLMVSVTSHAEPPGPRDAKSAVVSRRIPPNLVLPGVASSQPTIIQGRVIGPEGEPVANAFVGAVVRRHSSAECLPPPGSSAAICETYADDNGRFRMSGRALQLTADRLLTVFAATEDAVVWQHLDVCRAEHEATLQLTPGRSVGGRIVDNDGRPLGGVEVRLSALVLGPTDNQKASVLSFPSDSLEFGPLVSVTDDSGSFEFSNISKSVVHAVAEVQDSRHLPQKILLPVNAELPATFRLHPVRSVRGTLRYAISRAVVSEGHVLVTSYDTPSGISANRAEVDERGQFQCVPHFGANFTFGVVTTDGVYLPLREHVDAGTCFDGLIELLVPEGAQVQGEARSNAEKETERSVTVVGVARDPDGNPISRGIALTSSYNSAGNPDLPIRDGYFAVPNLAPDEHCRLYLLDKSNQLGATIDFRVGSSEPLEVVLTPCGTAAATLTDSRGEPYASTQLLPNEAPNFSLQLILTKPHPTAGQKWFGPVVERIELAKRLDANRYQQLQTTETGEVSFPTLIPGAEYRIMTSENIFVRRNGILVNIGESALGSEVFTVGQAMATRKRFLAEADKVLDLGVVRIPTIEQAHMSRTLTSDDPASAATPLGSKEEIQKFSDRLGHVSPAVIPAVVMVEGSGGGVGSGVVVSEDGFILSAAHCFKGPGESVTVRFPDGKSAEGVALGRCESTDAQLIKLDDTGEEWPFVEIRRSTEVQPGSWCWVAGYPSVYRDSAAEIGPLVPLRRIGRVSDVDSVQVTTVTPTAGGDSGGALFDLDGKLIGINSSSTHPDLTTHVATDFFLDHWQRLKASDQWRVYYSVKKDLVPDGQAVKNDEQSHATEPAAGPDSNGESSPPAR